VPAFAAEAATHSPLVRNWYATATPEHVYTQQSAIFQNHHSAGNDKEHTSLRTPEARESGQYYHTLGHRCVGEPNCRHLDIDSYAFRALEIHIGKIHMYFVASGLYEITCISSNTDKPHTDSNIGLFVVI